MKFFKRIKKGELEIDPYTMDINQVKGYFTEEENERVYGKDIQTLKRSIGNDGILALYKKKLAAYNKVIETDQSLMNEEDWNEYKEIKRWCTYYSVKSNVDEVKKKIRTSESAMRNIDLSLDEINFGKRKPP